MIKAAIFDMDGLIIDSEPLWEETYVERLVALGVPRQEITKPENKGRGARDFLNTGLIRIHGVTARQPTH